jgi:uncharacterized GH25 family protein
MIPYIKFLKNNLVISLGFILSISNIQAHEFWIEPSDYFLQNENLEAHLKVGQEFEGMRLMYDPNRFEDFKILSGSKNKSIDVKGTIGDVPAINFKPDLEGLLIIYHETEDQLVNYKKFSKFKSFVTEKGYEKLIVAHQERNLPLENFIESYRRYAKSLVAYNGIEGKDKKTGLLFEFVLSHNPYGELKDNIVEATLFYKKRPYPQNLVSIFIKNENNISLYQVLTDDKGRFSFSINPGESYLLDSVIIIPKKGNPLKKEPIWHSIWASTTFSIPKTHLDK